MIVSRDLWRIIYSMSHIGASYFEQGMSAAVSNWISSGALLANNFFVDSVSEHVNGLCDMPGVLMDDAEMRACRAYTDQFTSFLMNRSVTAVDMELEPFSSFALNSVDRPSRNGLVNQKSDVVEHHTAPSDIGVFDLFIFVCVLNRICLVGIPLVTAASCISDNDNSEGTCKWSFACLWTDIYINILFIILCMCPRVSPPATARFTTFDPMSEGSVGRQGSMDIQKRPLGIRKKATARTNKTTRRSTKGRKVAAAKTSESLSGSHIDDGFEPYGYAKPDPLAPSAIYRAAIPRYEHHSYPVSRVWPCICHRMFELNIIHYLFVLFRFKDILASLMMYCMQRASIQLYSGKHHLLSLTVRLTWCVQFSLFIYILCSLGIPCSCYFSLTVLNTLKTF